MVTIPSGWTSEEYCRTRAYRQALKAYRQRNHTRRKRAKDALVRWIDRTLYRVGLSRSSQDLLAAYSVTTSHGDGIPQHVDFRFHNGVRIKGYVYPELHAHEAS